MTRLLCPACSGNAWKDVALPERLICSDCNLSRRRGCAAVFFKLDERGVLSRTDDPLGAMDEATLLERLADLDALPLRLDGVLEALADPYVFLQNLPARCREQGVSITTRPDDLPATVRWSFTPRSLAHMLERGGWNCRWPARNPLGPRSFWNRAGRKLSRLAGIGTSRGIPAFEVTALVTEAAPEIGALPTLGLVMIAAPADLDLLIAKLEVLPPYFDQTVVVFDAEPGQLPAPLQQALDRQAGMIQRHNVNVVCRRSNFVFGDQRNHGHDLSHTDWIFQLDCDESVAPEQLRHLRSLAARLDRQGFTVCGLPRRHFDIRTGEAFERFPDYQYRLMRREERWVSGGAHEHPVTVIARPDKTWWCDQVLIEHHPRPRTNWWWRETDAAGNLRTRPPESPQSLEAVPR